MLRPTAPFVALALASLPTVAACEYYPPAQDASSSASSSNESSSSQSRAALERELQETQARVAELRAQAASSAHTGVAQRDTSGATRPISTAAPLAPFTSGGEERIECPAGFLAQSSKDTGCACVSSEDNLTIAPFQEAPCSTTARAEAGECIFTCAAPAPAAASADSAASPDDRH
jgi:hypothetical protein